MKNTDSIVGLSKLNETETKSIEGGVLPLAVVAFAKGFAAGASATGTVILAGKAIEKAVNDLTK